MTTATWRPQPHVLVLDGSPTIRELVREVLEEAGYRVSALGNDGVNVIAVKRLGPDLVVLDLLFGNDDHGWELLQELGQNPDTAELPLVICTGATHVLQSVQHRLAERGITVVTKPFDVDELVRAVGNGLARPDRVVPSWA